MTAAGALHLHSTRASGLRVFDQSISIEYVPVDDELARRHAVGLAAVTDRELLGTLFQLPADHPVPRRTLTAREQRLLRRAPIGAVDRSRGTVTRLAVPSLRVAQVIARSRLTINRVREFSRFGPYAARCIEVIGSIAPQAAAEAERFGITLIDGDGDVVLAGRPFVVRRHTSATWLFAETIYAELLRVEALPI